MQKSGAKEEAALAEEVEKEQLVRWELGKPSGKTGGAQSSRQAR